MKAIIQNQYGSPDVLVPGMTNPPLVSDRRTGRDLCEHCYPRRPSAEPKTHPPSPTQHFRALREGGFSVGN